MRKVVKPAGTAPAAPRIAVWDAPTRLFHWLLVGLIGFSWWSARAHEMDWHRLSGISVLGLLVFRLIWGFVGGSTARFARFVRSPIAVLAYLGRSPAAAVRKGHNPLGGYSVMTMLLLLVTQVGTGLFTTDTDGLESGPLSYLVDFDQSRVAAKIHKLSFDGIEILVALHVLAILFYLVLRRRNLVWPMVIGSEPPAEHSDHDEPVRERPVRFVLVALVAAALAWWVGNGANI